MNLRAALLAAAALLPVASAAQTSPAPAPARPSPTSTPPLRPISFTQRTLPNGLRVFAIRDPHSPDVALNVWYDVGAKDDPAGRSGFAHLFEHLMFKATRNLDAEQFDRLTEFVGGSNNASTNDDYTEYHETVPANHLQRLLFAEADRMSGLVVDQANFTSERAVVEEEYRSSVLARPYGKLFSTYLPALSYTRHPYARGVIGSIPDLDSATLSDVQAFHATYYRPDNAVLVVAGNFDPAELNRWVDRYFAPIKRPSAPIPRVDVAEPVRDRPVSATVYEPNTPLPAVMLSYPIPPDRAADIPALNVLAAILATGDSSRLHQALVYRDRLAQDVNANVDSRKDAGLFEVFAVLAGGKDAAAGEAALRQQIARLRDAPVTPDELAIARNQLLTQGIRQRETPEGQARLIASGVVIDGDPAAGDEQLARIAAVTPADVQRVARTYLADDRSAAIRYLPAEGKPAGAASTALPVAATVVTRPLARPADLALTVQAPAGQRAALPPVAAAIPLAVPRPAEMALSNGMRLVVVERHDQPLVTASVIAGGGGTLDPAGRAGTASLAADVMTRGTATRSATRIAHDAELLGSSIDAGADRDGSALSMTVTSNQLSPALAIVADVAAHAAFADDEIARARAQAIDAAGVALKSPGQLSSMAARRAVFGDATYGEVLSGTPRSLAAVTPADLKAVYARGWRPDQATLVLTGDVTAAVARAAAERAFAGWRAPASAATPTNPTLAAVPAGYPAPRVVVVDLADAGQAGVAVVRPAVSRSDPAFYRAEVANAVLGGGYSARLNEEVRIKRGLAYGASSRLAANRDAGLLAALTQTKNPSAPQVVEIVTGEMRRLGQAPAPAADELDARKASLVGDFGRAAETTGGLARLVGGYVLEGVPLAELQRYVPTVQAVPAAEVTATAARLLDPAQATIVVVGDARQFAEPLRRAYPALEVIPAAQLDLDRGSLRAPAPAAH